MTEPDGNLVDLSQEAGPVEFDVSTGFIDRLGKGERLAIRLRTADQLEKIARLAFGHDLAFEFRRDRKGGDLRVGFLSSVPSLPMRRRTPRRSAGV
jgi:hypothetical protein